MAGNKQIKAFRKKKVQLPEAKDNSEIKEEQVVLLPQPSRWLLLKGFGVFTLFAVVVFILFV
jgi:hypothetical protein